MPRKTPEQRASERAAWADTHAALAAAIRAPVQLATREEWLTELSHRMLPEIEARGGIKLPAYRVTCGFPSRGGEMGKAKRVRGQCWSASASDDRHAEIFVSPVEDDADTVAAILVHEMIHAGLPEAGHKRPFQVAAKAIGLDAPFTTLNATDALWAWLKPIMISLCAYPHRKLNAAHPVGAPKKQSARLLKAECDECGYVVRVTRKWVIEAGAPHCPLHGAMTIEGADEGEGGDDE